MDKKIFRKAIATITASIMINGCGYNFDSNTNQDSKNVTTIFEEGTHIIVSTKKVIIPIDNNSFNNQISLYDGYKLVDTKIIYEGFDIDLGKIYTYNSIFINDEPVIVSGYVDKSGNEIYNDFGTPINIKEKTKILK